MNCKSSLPDGVEVVETYNRSALIDRSVATLKTKLVEEFLVVVLVCILFLFHFRSSLVVILSLPVGILIAFLVMRLQGLNANIMSLGGIAIAIGAMVDAAIVMVETVHKKMEQSDYDPKKHWATIAEAAIEVGPPLFFSLLIITLSFLPVFTLQAQEGRMFAPLAFTKTYSMAGAALLSITLVPVLMGYFIRGKITPEQKNPLSRFLIWSYRPLINAVTRRPGLVLAVSALLVVVGMWPANRLGSEFMPDLNEGDIMYMPTTFPGISIGKAQQLLQQTDKLIKSVPEVKSVFGKIGRAETATDPAPLTMIETVIQLKPESEWREGVTIDSIKDELNQRVKLPGVTNAWVWPIKTRIDMLATGIKTPVGIKVGGADLGVIQDIGKDIEKVLAGSSRHRLGLCRTGCRGPLRHRRYQPRRSIPLWSEYRRRPGRGENRDRRYECHRNRRRPGTLPGQSALPASCAGLHRTAEIAAHRHPGGPAYYAAGGGRPAYRRRATDDQE